MPLGTWFLTSTIMHPPWFRADLLGLTSQQYLVLSRILSKAAYGICLESHAHMCDAVGLDRRTFRKAFNALVEKGFVEVEARRTAADTARHAIPLVRNMLFAAEATTQAREQQTGAPYVFVSGGRAVTLRDLVRDLIIKRLSDKYPRLPWAHAVDGWLGDSGAADAWCVLESVHLALAQLPESKMSESDIANRDHMRDTIQQWINTQRGDRK